MGLFDFIKGQFIDVIEWVDYSRDLLVWKFPDQDKEIKMGAQLTVRESQVAILINEGKMADVFEPGRYELTTRNMPLLTTIKSWKYGFESPFKVDVYYFNTRQFTDNKWGTPSPVTIPDSKFGQVEFRAFGSYNFRIKDYATFFKEFAGTDPKVTLSDVEGTLKGKLVDRFTEIVAEMAATDFSFVQMQANKTEFVQALMPRISEYFASFGLELTDFSIQSITLPPELQEYLRKNTQMNMVGDMQRFMQFQAANAVQKSAENPSGGNAGMDMGTGFAMGNMMMNMMNQNSQQGGQGGQAPQQESKEDIMKMLKELGELKESGILTEEEFAAKKKELLAKL
ncbi:SPFH domain-containing protein [Pontibacter sp. G13]|uniref:SPFH domain-containing protein n=1 Tax=Pontibacter sp. G13 TaxID=3074898 RepID=UPI00288C409B|nr:SPFH domain-containing protein [Pontibacter sp. G13]WNJ21407.1 SPFH domain-containing protein [Pontibacter sp. G13]